MQDFRELRVWKIAHELTVAIYRATEAQQAREEETFLL